MDRLAVPLAIAAIAATGCGGDAPSVRLVVVSGPCGRVAGVSALLVTPLGDVSFDRRPVDLDGTFTLTNLPPATAQLAVEVTVDQGRVAAVGKTARFELGALRDGDEIPIAMAPLDGFCAVQPLPNGRDRPLVAAAGTGALVVGGDGEAGPLATAALFELATDGFRPIALPTGFGDPLGLTGATLTPLPDGRIALIGGPVRALTVFDPVRGGFGDGLAVDEAHAHHAAVALDDRRVLLAGGCATLRPDGTCDPATVTADTRILDLIDRRFTPGPMLAAPRLGGQAFREHGVDGVLRVLIVGGTSPTGAPLTTAERLDLGGAATAVLPGAGAVGTVTDAGAVVTAFAPIGATAIGAAAALVPGIDSARPLPTTSPRAGAVLVTQEDGLVLALGGGPPLRYLTTSGTWTAVLAGADAPALPGGHAAVRLGDGSVLVVGGRDGATPDARAWRFRPGLTGPLTVALTVAPSRADASPLTPLDPARFDAAPQWRLRSENLAVLGGPVGGTMTVRVLAAVPGEGLGLLIGFVDPGHHHRVELVPGQPTVVTRRDGDQVTTVCRGETLLGGGLASTQLELEGAAVRVTSGGRTLVSCALPDLAPGRVGVAALGAGVLAVETIEVIR